MTALEYVVREYADNYGKPFDPGLWQRRSTFVRRDTRIVQAAIRGSLLHSSGYAGWPAHQWGGHFAGDLRLYRYLRERRPA